jgi:hypothetical protein
MPLLNESSKETETGTTIAIGGFGLSGTKEEVLKPVMVARLVAIPVLNSEIDAIRRSFSFSCKA